MLFYVMVGGAIGSGARYLVGVNFPHGTIIVNLVGCFVMGAVVQLATAGNWSQELRVTIAVGVLGGFTTYSSFNHETFTMLTSGATGAALANIAVTLFGGLAAGWLGLLLARAIG